MRKTTIKLLAGLAGVNPGLYRVDAAENAQDSEIIHLQGDYILVIDEDDPLPTVSLDERQEVGGDVTIASWVVDNDTVLDEIVVAALNV